MPCRDGFDDWAQVRDKRLDDSLSARYVSPGVIGYQDLDAYGRWHRLRITARCGFRRPCPPAGRRIATVTGPGSLPGAGPGLTISPGDSLPSTMAAGFPTAEVGMGSWSLWRLLESVLCSGAGRLDRRTGFGIGFGFGGGWGVGIGLTLVGSRWVGVNPSTPAIADGARRLVSRRWIRQQSTSAT